MKKKLIILILGVFCFVSLAMNLDAKEQQQYKIFQHKNFSVEYPNWGVNKKTDKGRLLLKVSEGAKAIQVEVFKGSPDTLYDSYRAALEKSGSLIGEDSSKNILVQKVWFLFFDLTFYKKFVGSNGNTYIISFVTKKSQVDRYAPLREHVFNSAQGIPEAYEGKTFKLDADKKYPCGIYLTDSQGTYLKQIYKSRSLIVGAKLSHDGKKIVFYEAVGIKLKPGAEAEDLSTLVHAEICTINSDGTGYKVLTHNDYADIQPNWAEDNRHIIFSRDGEGRAKGFDLDIFIMNDQGGNVRNLTRSSGIIDADPHAYGGKIAFTRSAANKISQSVWIMNEDGSGMYKLVTPPRSGKSKVGYYWGDFDPTISFDSKKVLVERLEDDSFKVWGKRVGRYSTYVANIDGSGLRNIGSKVVSDGFPHWLPDGRIVFAVVSDNLDAFRKLYTMNSDGSNRQPLIRTKPGNFIHGRPSSARTDDGEDLVVFVGRFNE